MAPPREARPGPAWTAIVLTGGASRRMGQDKAGATVGGVTMLDLLLTRFPSTVPVVIAGPKPHDPPRPVLVRREDPPGGGPVAGIAAALPEVTTPVVAVCAVDMPLAAGVVAALAQELAALPHVEGLVPAAEGRLQHLCAAYRTDALRAAVARLGDPAGRSVRDLVAGMRAVSRPVPAGDLRIADADTPDELAALRRAAAGSGILATRGDERGSGMKDWVDALRRELGIEADVDIDLVLDVAKDAAHGVQRPAAPVTTYLVGYAVASGMAAAQAAAVVQRLADTWPPRD